MSIIECGDEVDGADARRSPYVAGLRSRGVWYELEQKMRRWVVGSEPGSDIVVADPSVALVHCTIERRATGQLIVRDRSGDTRIDGVRVEAAELAAGSVLKLGEVVLYAVARQEDGSALTLLQGKDPPFREVVNQALRIAPSDCSLLLVGETGTGKDLIARVIHEASRRAGGRFVAVNCGAFPHELIGTELFGHERGAFTGAHTERDGYFVEAHGGTLFLDELGELPLELQPHLLRVLETRQVRRVGGRTERDVDVRIIAATNRLDGLGTDQSPLRTDLYHRLATVVLTIPPLRSRMGDLPLLVQAALAENKAQDRVITDDAWYALNSHHWPGNVRELRHAVARAVALGGPKLVGRDFFPEVRATRMPRWGAAPAPSTPPAGPGTAPPPPVPAPAAGYARDGSTDEREPLAPYELMMRGAMEQALTRCGSIRGAANELGMAKSTFADRVREWGIVPLKPEQRVRRRRRRKP